MKQQRIVFDTNVLISALLIPGSPPQRALLKAQSECQLVISAELVAELRQVLDRPKFERYITASERDQFLAALVLEADLVELRTHVSESRDPQDNHILSLALDATANFIVTGDDDLLTLHPFRGIEILTPAAFVERAA